MKQLNGFIQTVTETELKSSAAPYVVKNTFTAKPVEQNITLKIFNTNAKAFVPGGAKTTSPATVIKDQKDVK